MNFLPPEIEDYVIRHTGAETEVLRDLNHETWQKVLQPRMLSGAVQGRFLSMISKLIRPRRILEIGTYTGYSALCLAEGLSAQGELVTIEINDELQTIQDKYFRQSPLGSRINRIFGNALDIIPTLDPEFDLVFIDADKENYVNYYQSLIKILPSGSCMIFDNVLWSGKVLLPPDQQDEETRSIQALNEMVTGDPTVDNVLVPLRDGVMMVRKK